MDEFFEDFVDDELAANMLVSTPVAKDDHVKIILKWEKDPRSAVAALAKLVEDETALLQLFGAAVALAEGDEGYWDATEDGSK